MEEIKNVIKSKSFTINEFVLKNIKKINLELNEFLLILYFINISNTLDMIKIKKYLNFTEEDILNTFNSLISKNLIEVIVNKDKKQVEEEISLELFYDKLVLNMDQKEVNNSDIFSKFESGFGRTLSPMEYEIINSWLEGNIKEPMILKALDEAIANGVTNIRYVDKIIYEWSKKGVKSETKTEELIELFDYNWLEDDNETTGNN